MVKKKSFIQRLKEWEAERRPGRSVKVKLSSEEEQLLRKRANLSEDGAITVIVRPRNTRAFNIKMYPDDFSRLEQVAALIADGNQSEAIRKALGVIYDDMVEKGLVKTF